MNNEQEFKIIAERSNEIYDSRETHNFINLLGWKGGTPYIDERLTRFPGEATEDWDGGTRSDGSVFKGRKETAHVVPHLTRIVEKINQYVLGVNPKREGISEEVEKDISANGESVTQIMKLANSYLTVNGWCWLGIDAPFIAPEEQISQEQKEMEKIRPYWKVYSALEVVDWKIDSTGNILWVLTEGWDYVADSPYEVPYSQRYRQLWELGGIVTKYLYDPKSNDKIVSKEVMEISLKDIVPFVLVGKLDTEPIGFDNLESINRTILDLESCNRQNFYNSVFPQMYVPASLLDVVMQKFNVDALEAVNMIVGYNYPIFLSEGDATPGFIMPDASTIGTMRTELDSLRNELFNSVGLMLQQDTKQVASAESKAWDHLDVEQVMKERASILQDAERKAVLISMQWDPEFPEWDPEYNSDFNITNFKEDIEALIKANDSNLPIEMKQQIQKHILHILDKKIKISDEDKESIISSIDSIDSIDKIEELEDEGDDIDMNTMVDEDAEDTIRSERISRMIEEDRRI